MRWIAAILTFGMALGAVAQTPAGQKPKFEVVSIKPAQRVGPINTTPGGLFIASGQTVRRLITSAYKAGRFHVVGGPGWIDSDIWQIEAKPSEGTIPVGMSRSEIQKKIDSMLQSLLEDRFQLQIHHETRELSTYELVVAKAGLKMKLSDDQTEPVAGPRPRPGDVMPQELARGTLRMGGGRAEGKAVSWDTYFNIVFSNALFDRTVEDKTNLNPKALYDMKLEWSLSNSGTADAASTGSPSIFTAIQEQLGLKLESAKANLDVIVVDSVSRPTEN